MKRRCRWPRRRVVDLGGPRVEKWPQRFCPGKKNACRKTENENVGRATRRGEYGPCHSLKKKSFSYQKSRGGPGASQMLCDILKNPSPSTLHWQAEQPSDSISSSSFEQSCLDRGKRRFQRHISSYAWKIKIARGTSKKCSRSKQPEEDAITRTGRR